MVNTESSHDKDLLYKYEPQLIKCIQEGSIEDIRKLADIITLEHRQKKGDLLFLSGDALKRLVEYFVDPRISNTIRITLTAEISQFIEYLDDPKEIFSIIFFKYLLAIQQCVKKQQNSQNYDLVIKAIEHVEKGYANSEFSLEKVASELFVSYGHLCSIFSKFTGIRFKDYLIDFRMKKACELLGKGGYEIQQIANLTGYSSSRYFNMAFNKHFGMSPSAYAMKRKAQT